MTTPNPSASNAPEAIALSDELLALSLRAVALDFFETSYHALAAALHAAEGAGDAARIVALRSEAARQQAAVDARAPDHRLSAPSGKERGHPGWFDALALLADAAAARLRGSAAVARAGAARRGAPTSDAGPPPE